MEKKAADDCEHWLFPSCPEIHHPLMNRFRSGSPVRDLAADVDEMDKLCGTCAKFSPRKMMSSVKRTSHLIFSSSAGAKER